MRFIGSTPELPSRAERSGLVDRLWSVRAAFRGRLSAEGAGHLSSLLGFTPGPLDTSMPVLVFCIAFGLSMDYELFVVSRIKERHDAGDPTQTAAVAGLARSGRIVTPAAVLMAITFFAFATANVRFVQFFGIATGLAILLDSTVLRGILLLASMRLLGERSWYAPRLARRLHAKLRLTEADLPAT